MNRAEIETMRQIVGSIARRLKHAKESIATHEKSGPEPTLEERGMVRGVERELFHLAQWIYENSAAGYSALAESRRRAAYAAAVEAIREHLPEWDRRPGETYDAGNGRRVTVPESERGE